MDILRRQALEIFGAAVNAVLPQKLIELNLRLAGASLKIANQLDITVNNNIHVVGAGKATLGMASAVENILFNHIQGGIISIPVGTQEIFKKNNKVDMFLRPDTRIKIIEGAAKNMPDENSATAAREIKTYIQPLTKNDVLLVLISGGASALLPLPIPPITLEEKSSVTRLLVSVGATIQELNCVRKQLSQLKGGGLAEIASPAKVVALILSDVIRNPLDQIGSGPTVVNPESPLLALEILDRYHLTQQVPESVLHVLRSKSSSNTRETLADVHNFLIGSNSISVDAAKDTAKDLGYVAVSITNELDGSAQAAGEFLAFLAFTICKYRRAVNFNFHHEINNHPLSTKINDNNMQELIVTLEKPNSSKLPICILAGGETTVVVDNTAGKGGRNQELVLSCCLHLNRLFSQTKLTDESNVVVLSAGTDGIDGPTDAAGAMTDLHQYIEAFHQNLDPQKYLAAHDSYSFYQRLSDGQYLIRTGHTGTNVMDVHVVIIS